MEPITLNTEAAEAVQVLRLHQQTMVVLAGHPSLVRVQAAVVVEVMEGLVAHGVVIR